MGGTSNGESESCPRSARSEEHTSELQSRQYLVCRLLLEKKKTLYRTIPPAASSEWARALRASRPGYIYCPSRSHRQATPLDSTFANTTTAAVSLKKTRK